MIGHTLLMALEKVGMMVWDTCWALVLGFAISAGLQVFISQERMGRYFGRADLRSVALATGFGAASSSCSYAAAAAARSAFSQGAALIPALAFMFASTNLVLELGVVLWLLIGWQALADAFFMDWQMLWKEILVGFVIAGCLAAFVPPEGWKAMFLESGPGWVRLLENALAGPLIAIISFVCSVGNIPLASVLWSGGISFGGVLSFIYADLLVVPLLVIYRKYFGTRAAAYISGVFFVAMSGAGIIVDLVFQVLGLVPQGPRPQSVATMHTGIEWNYTTWLNIVAFLLGGFLLYLRFRNKDDEHEHHHHGAATVAGDVSRD